jgi:hypothetical protein
LTTAPIRVIFCGTCPSSSDAGSLQAQHLTGTPHGDSTDDHGTSPSQVEMTANLPLPGRRKITTTEVQITQVTHQTTHVLTHGSQEHMHLPAQCRIEAALNHQPLSRVYGTCKFVDLQCDRSDRDPCPTVAPSASASRPPPVIRPGLTSPMTFKADDGVPEAGCLPR